uniref:Uncharacterized protein n=1 Tax=Isometrus maculatus TaxID=497827 RepID=A0A0U1S4P3_ISOMC|nr:hypothetical protein [Isometrus maculatus]
MRRISVILTVFMLVALREYASSTPLHQVSQLYQPAKMALSAAKAFIKPQIKNVVMFTPSKREDKDEMRRSLTDHDNGRGFMVFSTYDDYGHWRYGRSAKNSPK